MLVAVPGCAMHVGLRAAPFGSGTLFVTSQRFVLLLDEMGGVPSPVSGDGTVDCPAFAVAFTNLLRHQLCRRDPSSSSMAAPSPSPSPPSFPHDCVHCVIEDGFAGGLVPPGEESEDGSHNEVRFVPPAGVMMIRAGGAGGAAAAAASGGGAAAAATAAGGLLAQASAAAAARGIKGQPTDPLDEIYKAIAHGAELSKPAEPGSANDQ